MLASAAPAAASGAPVWLWKRDYAGCALRQESGPNGRLFQITRTPGTEGTGFFIGAAKPITSVAKTRREGSVTFVPDVGIVTDVTVIEGHDGRREIYAHSTDPEAPAKFARAREITFSHPKIAAIRFALREPAAAAQALRACEDSKMREWGIDPAFWRALAAKPMPKDQKKPWLNWLDYPDRKVAYKNDINVVARLDLNADGSIKNCVVVNKPPEEFVAATCQGLRINAKLTPARDASGKAVEAPYIVLVRFGAFLL
jgi:Gram-negative bacterial TonB protein C-terminal